jgi:8-oxo-dGTP pyrophosphatase MutT (NUDIX family)
MSLRLRDGAWPFTISHVAMIADNWLRRTSSNATLWNGDFLIALDVDLAEGTLTAEFVRADYASFLAWRDNDFPDKSAFNIFGMGVIVSVDNVLVFGEMNTHTAAAGMIYPPGGSLEPRDVTVDGQVDVDGSIRFELLEETGLDVSSYRRGKRFAIVEGQRIALVQSYYSGLTIDKIDAAFRRFARGQDLPELVRLVPVRSLDDVTLRFPPWARETARCFLAEIRHK